MNTKELEKPKRDKTCRAARSRNSDEGGQGLQSGRIGCAGSIIAFLFSGMEGAMSVEALGWRTVPNLGQRVRSTESSERDFCTGK